jgi:hypothetical protein
MLDVQVDIGHPKELMKPPAFVTAAWGLAEKAAAVHKNAPRAGAFKQLAAAGESLLTPPSLLVAGSDMSSR